MEGPKDFTREDMVTEFRQLGVALCQSLQDQLRDTLRAELPSALQHAWPQGCANQGTAWPPPPAHPMPAGVQFIRESVGAATNTCATAEHLLPPGEPRTADRMSHTKTEPTRRITFKAADLSYNDDELEISLFRKGYAAKKVYDGLAEVNGLDQDMIGQHSQGTRSLQHSQASPNEQAVKASPHEQAAKRAAAQSLREAGGSHDQQREQAGSLKIVAFPTVGVPDINECESMPRYESGAPVEVAGKENRISVASNESGRKNRSPPTPASPDLRSLRVTARRKSIETLRSASIDFSSRPSRRGAYILATEIATMFVDTAMFDSAVCCVILCYSCAIGFQTQWSAQNVEEESPGSFAVVETIFCVIFSIELVIRVLASRSQFFVGAEWQWNMFDLIVVLLQIVDLTLAAIFTDSSNTNMGFMRVLRVLRLIRVVRLVRLVRLMSEMRSMVSSILTSLKSLGFTLILICLLVFIVGVFLTQLVTNARIEDPDNDDLLNSLKYFQALDMSCLVLFQCLTGGVDWGETLDPLMKHISPAISIVYCMYISFGVLCMLNVVTGIFVESACNSSAEERDCNMVSRLQSYLCKTTNGTLTWEDFEAHLDDPEIKLYFQTVDLDISEAHGLFRLLDSDSTGVIQAEEFVMGCVRLRGFAKAVDVATLMYENRRWHRRIDRLLHSAMQPQELA